MYRNLFFPPLLHVLCLCVTVWVMTDLFSVLYAHFPAWRKALYFITTSALSQPQQYWKGVVVGCLRYCQSPNQTKKKKKNKNERAKIQISRSAAWTVGGKGMSFTDDDDLDAGEWLLINTLPSWQLNWPKKPKPANSADILARSFDRKPLRLIKNAHK